MKTFLLKKETKIEENLVKYEEKKIEANSKEDACYNYMKSLGYEIEEEKDEIGELKIHIQLDYKNVMLGYTKIYTIASDGCLLTCGTYLYNFYMAL